MMKSTDYDVLVIGGGPAGLSATLYLARFMREVALFDAGQGRSTWHQVNENYLGFPGGIAARELRDLGQRQVAAYENVTIHPHKIEDVRRYGDRFVARGQAGVWTGRSVILCTGVVDHYPRFEGWDEHVGRSMFWCITCDGYACRDRQVVVVGNTDDAAIVALQLQRFTRRVTVLTNSAACHVEPVFERRLVEANVPLIRDRIARVDGVGGEFQAIWTESGQCLELDQLFSVQGSTPQSDLARSLGVALGPHGYITVDTEQKTNVPGVYAAGDVTRLHSHQVTTAVHEGGQAAAAANYYLYPLALRHETG